MSNSNFKEIVTKTVVGKGRKTFKTNHSLTPENTPNTVLGCWVINHTFTGTNRKNEVTVNGSFDVNVWYSYDNDSKTAVTTRNFTYQETLKLRVKDYDSLTNENEIIVRSLKQPTVQDVNIKDNEVHLSIEKELGVEIVGESKVKIAILEDELPWDDIEEEPDINEDYIKEE
ncbi:MAG: outer spore coat protein CotE [Firmicutes bacterium]|nr:outer spore coat protein CotE [Bacillota bacterium]